MSVICLSMAFCQNKQIIKSKDAVPIKIVKRIQVVSTLDDLTPFLNSENVEVRKLAIKRWDILPFDLQNVKKELNLTKKLLNSKYYEVKRAARSRYSAIARLQDIGKEGRKIVLDIENTKNLDALRHYLLSTSPIIRYFAIWKLQRFTPESNCKSILKTLIASDNWMISSIAMAKYCKIADSEEIKNISVSLKQKKVPWQTKMELIRGISRNLDEKSAFQILTDFINYKINQGPHCSLGYAYQNKEYLNTINSSIEAISNLKTPELNNYFLGIFKNPKVYWGIREYTYKLFLSRQLSYSNMSFKDKIKFLLKDLTAPGVGLKENWNENGKTDKAIRNSAISNILEGYGPSTIPILQKEMKMLAQDDLKKKAIERVLSRIKLFGKKQE